MVVPNHSLQHGLAALVGSTPRLADSGALGEIRRTAGNHRRISRTALLDYKARSKERQAKGLDAKMEASQKLGLYDDELAGVPRRAGR